MTETLCQTAVSTLVLVGIYAIPLLCWYICIVQNSRIVSQQHRHVDAPMRRQERPANQTIIMTLLLHTTSLQTFDPTDQHQVKTGGLLLTISNLSTMTLRLLPS